MCVLYKADTRGHKNHGWLDTHHTFSFAGYYDPERIHFLYTAIYRDSMGNGSVIRSSEVQVMSAGAGVTHSEFNANQTEDLRLCQSVQTHYLLMNYKTH
ncbi:hypothetical protein FACS189426_19790 [Bacteroidia bacterium]|nr:hypothetical protein FACS189426_19790 [Bacteroidia bacterium]